MKEEMSGVMALVIAKMHKLKLHLMFVLLVTTMGMSMVQRLSPHHGGRAMDVFMTCLFFLLATLTMQAILALVLARQPAPAPRLATRCAWMFGSITWMFLVHYFLVLTTISSRLPGLVEWTVAGTAILVNLGITAYIVMRPFKVEDVV